MISVSDIYTLVAALPARPALVLTAQHVPSPWAGSVQDVNWLMRPLLAHVGLDALDVYVETFSDDGRLTGFGATSRGRPPHQPAVWYAETTHDLCVLGAQDGATDDVTLVLADLAHAAAAAALDGRRMLPDDASFRARACDLAAIRVGLGALLRARPGALRPDEVDAASG